MDNPIFRKLPSNGKRVYIYMLNKISYNSDNPFFIELTYWEMKGVISPKTMSKMLKILIDIQFIRKVYRGSAWGCRKVNSLYEIIGPNRNVYSTPDGGFVMLFKGLLKNTKFKKLSGSAFVRYIYLRAAFDPEKYLKDKTVELPHLLLEDMMSADTMTNTTKELVNAGFIEVERYGNSTPKRTNSIYKFVGKWKFYYYKGWRI